MTFIKHSSIKTFVVLLSCLALISCDKTVDFKKEKEYLKNEKGIIYYKGQPFNGKILNIPLGIFSLDSYMEAEIEEGKLDGNAKTFYKDGVLYSEGKYLDNKKEGLWKYYDEKGKFSFDRKFINGKQIKD